MEYLLLGFFGAISIMLCALIFKKRSPTLEELPDGYYLVQTMTSNMLTLLQIPNNKALDKISNTAAGVIPTNGFAQITLRFWGKHNFQQNRLFQKIGNKINYIKITSS